MSPALRIARHEMRLAWRDGRFLAAAGVVLLLIAVALLAATGRYRDIRAQQDAARQETYAQWVAQPAKNPHSAAHYGMYAFKPTLVTSLIDPGVDAFAGVAAFLEPHRQNEFVFRPAQDAGGAARFGDLSVAMVLQVLVPLLIIIQSFGAIAGERDAGTLRQLIASGTPTGAVVLGKTLGIGATVGLLLVPAVAIGSMAIRGSAVTGEFIDSLPRLAGLAGAYFGYFLAWLVFALAVSAWSRTARLALVVLLTSWGAATLIVPRVAVDVARTWNPTPSRIEFEQQIARDLAALPDVAKQAERQALARYGVSTLDELPVSFAGVEMSTAETNTTAIYEQRMNEIRSAFDRQNALQGALGLFDPAMVLRAVSMALAGTDYAHFRHFSAAVERYRQQFVNMMNEDMTRHGKGRDFGYVASADLWARVPPFAYTPPAGSEVIRQQALNFVVLAVWIVVCVLALIVATQRLTVV